MHVESRVECAWFQPLRLKYDNLLSSFAFNFNLRSYGKVYPTGLPPNPRLLGLTPVGSSRYCSKCPSTHTMLDYLMGWLKAGQRLELSCRLAAGTYNRSLHTISAQLEPFCPWPQVCYLTKVPMLS